MSENATSSSSSSYFVLSMYVNVGPVKYLYFVLLLCVYVVTVGSNLLLLLVVLVSRSLREPMYLFLGSLFVNQLYGSSGLLPLLLLLLLSDSQRVPAALCFLQIFCLYTYAHVEFSNLAVMAYDRYLAICRPLRYRARMTSGRAAVLVAGVWLYSFLKFLISLLLNLRLRLCGNTISSLYCHNYLVAKLACSRPRVSNIYGLVGVVLTVVLPLIPIAFSYAKILQVCFSGSGRTRQKAVSTCAPQLVSLLNFSFGCFFEILQSRFDTSGVPVALRIFLSLYFLLIQPLLTPLMYGMQMSTIQRALKHLLSW